MYNYQVTAHRATAVTHSLVGNFTSLTSQSLVLRCEIVSSMIPVVIVLCSSVMEASKRRIFVIKFLKFVVLTL